VISELADGSNTGNNSFTIRADRVVHYALDDVSQDVLELPGEDASSSDEDAYHAAVEAREAPFEPLRLLSAELGIGITEVLDSLDRARRGTRLWPSVPLKGHNPAQGGGAAVVPIPPMWDWLRDEPGEALVD